MTKDYSKFRLKEFDHWELYLHQTQFPFLGRCYAWATRDQANFLTDMNSDERNELFGLIIPTWKKAILQLIGSSFSRENLAILGNDAHHLHAHLIPRFNGSIQKYGITFEDQNPTGNYSPYPKKDLSQEILFSIRGDLISLLNSQ